jgi:hypothetical protein
LWAKHELPLTHPDDTDIAYREMIDDIVSIANPFDRNPPAAGAILLAWQDPTRGQMEAFGNELRSLDRRSAIEVRARLEAVRQGA